MSRRPAIITIRKYLSLRSRQPVLQILCSRQAPAMLSVMPKTSGWNQQGLIGLFWKALGHWIQKPWFQFGHFTREQVCSWWHGLTTLCPATSIEFHQSRWNQRLSCNNSLFIDILFVPWYALITFQIGFHIESGDRATPTTFAFTNGDQFTLGIKLWAIDGVLVL